MKRKLAAFLLLLVGGAIINIAVACGLLRTLPITDGRFVPPRLYFKSENRVWLVHENDGGIRGRQIKWFPIPREWGGWGIPENPRLILSRPASQFVIDATIREAYDEFQYLMVDERGWPQSSVCFVHLVTLPDSRHYSASDKSLLTIRPIRPGFAINTIFYAGILWLLFAAPGFVRRRYRIKRGLCPSCAYPVGESNVCTECGAPKPLRKQA